MKKDLKRILVALDVSAHNLKALEAAADLAVKEEAELIGLFVEDLNLFRTVDLSFVREIRFPTAVDDQMDLARLERELKVRAGQIRSLFAEIAERAHVQWSFQIVRGHLTRELVSAASAVDFLLLASRGLLAREEAIRRLLEESCSAAAMVPPAAR